MKRLVIFAVLAVLCSSGRASGYQKGDEVMMFSDSTRTDSPMSKDPHVIFFKGRYLLYYSMPPASHPKESDPAGWTIGIAASSDLTHWEKVGEVCPKPMSDLEKNGYCAPCARVIDGKVHLFYQSYGNWERDAICHATSEDGLNFVGDPGNPIFSPGKADWTCGRAIDAEVYKFKGKYYLYFATRDTNFTVQMQGVAVADSDTDFSRGSWSLAKDAPILKPELPWEQECIEGASVIEKEGRLFMFYAGAYNNHPQQIGVAVSEDGVNWERLSDKPFLANGPEGSWNSSESGHPHIFEAPDGKTYLFYQGNNTNGATWHISKIEVIWEGKGKDCHPVIGYNDRYRNWIKVIGSDEFGGRKPMSEFEKKTIEYLAGEFRSLGLKPAFGGSYFQSVKEISTTVSLPEKGIPVKAAKGSFRLSSPGDLMVWTTRGEEKVTLENVEYVFCGFGIDAPEYGWNDFEGVDVRGKIVIAMVNDPGYYDSSLFRGRNMTYYGRWTYKLEQAQKMGAAGCLILHNEAAAGYGWHVCVNGHQESNLALFDESDNNLDELGMRGWFSEAGCRKLFEKAGVDYDIAIAAAKKPGFKAIPLKARSSFTMDVRYEVGETFNVGAVLPGTDLKDECVVFSAHWDHFGIGKPDETGDSIYNGAADNGSGLAALLMIAAKLQTMPAPRRSILFLSATSEESGLFGSQYYCEHPAFPMEKTATCINFDCIAPAVLTGEVTLLGGGESGIDNYMIAAAAAQGRKIIFDNDNSDGWFFRSDHWNFVKKGVPAVIFKAGKMAEWYHKPSDEYSESWDVEGSVANVNLMFSAGLSIANSDDNR